MRFDDFTALGGGGARPPRRAERPVVVHELPRRLRLKMPLLTRPHLDTNHLVNIVAEIDGVRSVRINVGAESVIVDYDGMPAARRAVLRKLSGLTLGDVPFREARGDEDSGFSPLALRAALLVASLLLPAPLGRLLTWAAIAHVSSGASGRS